MTSDNCVNETGDDTVNHMSTIIETVEVAPGTHVSGTYDGPNTYLHFRLEMDINKRLLDAGVYGTKTPTNIDFNAVRDFELALKSGDWLEMTSPHTSAETTTTTFTQQFKEFIGNFFDKSVDMNDITGVLPSIVQLDDDKIRVQLSRTCEYDTSIPLYFESTGAFNPEAAKPVDPDCLASHLMSVRQIAQVLEAFGTMGVSSKNSRLKIINNDQYVLELHEGDSIMAETSIVDKDGLPNNQYKETVKIQFIQKSSCPYNQPYPVMYVLHLEGQATDILESPTTFTRTPNDTDFIYNDFKAVVSSSTIDNIGNLFIYRRDQSDGSYDIIYSSYGIMNRVDIQRINQTTDKITTLVYNGSNVEIIFLTN